MSPIRTYSCEKAQSRSSTRRQARTTAEVMISGTCLGWVLRDQCPQVCATIMVTSVKPNERSVEQQKAPR
eukprot:scaffold244995_cov32-Tisochrysis_lutea.AAC.2